MSTLTLRNFKNKPPGIRARINFIVKLFACALFSLFTIAAESQKISDIEVSETGICSGGDISISFRLTDGNEADQYFNSATSFQVYLIDNSGSVFTLIGNPFQVSIHQSFQYDPVNNAQQTITIPAGTATAVYKIALVSSSPSFDGRTLESLSNSFTVNEPVSILTQPSAAKQAVCENGTASLNVDASGTNPSYQWYQNSIPSNSGGTIIAGATGATYSPETSTAGTSYYYAVISNSCSQITSELSGAVIVTAIPAITSTGDGTACEGGVATLKATASEGTINWYDQATGGTILATGTEYSPSVATTTSYYTDASYNGCTTASRTAVVATAIPIPVVSTKTNRSICGGGVVALKATPSFGTINWYESATGGSPLLSGPSYSVNLTSTKTYYVDATANGCTTAVRTPVTGTVKIIPTVTTTIGDEVCGNGVVNLKATVSAGTINWYSSATGGSSLLAGSTYSPDISATTTYYVAATANGCTTATRAAITGTVNEIPTIIATTEDVVCASGVVNLKATSSAGTINWYTAATGGTLLTTGTSYSPSISATTTYYVDATENGCTTATRTAITGTVNAIPTITSKTGDAVCGGGVVSLNATSSEGTINWYPVATGGTRLTTGTSYSPSISATTTYYIDATENGCTTATRTAVTGTVNAIPTITSKTDDASCGNGIVALKATSSAGTINWYSAATGGTLLATGTSYSPSILSTTTYYVDATANGCTTSTRTAITGTVNAIPNITSKTEDAVCGNGIVALKATSSAGTINWYSAATGGTRLTTGTSYSPLISATTTYYVDATENGCTTSTRTAITGTVNAIPTITSKTEDAVCTSGVVNLKATASAGTINWYTAATGGALLATGTGYSPLISATTTYYVDATANGCTTSTRTAITGTVNAIPTITSKTEDAVCGNGIVALKATSSAGTINWYTAATGGTLLATGTSYSPSISATTTFYVDATANGCTTATRTAVKGTVNPFPAAAGTISGTATVCPFTPGLNFSVGAIANANTYSWTVPSGWNITGGVGTNSITVTSGDTGSGLITVTGVNDCGEGVSKTFAVTVRPGTPAIPGAISGTVAQCPGLSNETYSINTVTDEDTYTWTVPSGWSIISGNGTTAIKVSTGSTGKNGYISVTAGNTCGTSVERNVAVTVLPGTPAKPSTISGTAVVCPGLTGLTYFIASVTNATSYDWKVPSGWVITSDNGTTITVTSGSSGKNGNISVSAVNSCGASVESTLAVTVSAGKPATPGTITGSSTCSDATATYSIASVATADTYSWTVPGGWAIVSGQNSPVLTVKVGAFGKNGNVAVTASNNCGTSAASALFVTVKKTPSVAATPSTQSLCTDNTISTISISNPNAVSGTTYSWTRSNTGPAGVTSLVSNGTTNVINGTVSNTTTSNQTTEFTITATASGCSSTTSATVVVYPAISNNELTTPTKQYNCDSDIQVIVNQGSNALSGGNGTYSFEWQISDNGNNQWETIPGETGISLNILQTDKNVFYRRIVRAGDCAISYSDGMHVNLSAIKVEDPALVTGGGNYCSGGPGVPIGIDGSTTGAFYQLYLGTTKVGAPVAGTGMALSFGQFTAAGTYKVIGYTVNPDASVCSRDMQGTVKVIIDAKATVANAGSNKNLCDVTTTTLSANSPAIGTGKWSLLSGSASVSSPSSPTSGVSNLKEGDQAFLWTITNGTCTSESQVTIHIDKPATTPIAGDAQNLCNVTSSTLAGNVPLAGTGVWTKVSGNGVITNPGDPQSNITGLLPGNNIFKWTITNPGVCQTPQASQVVVHVDAPATIAKAGNQQNICISSPTVTLSANTATTGTGKWTRTSGAGTISSPNSPSSSVTSLATGNNVFQWTITNGTCSSSDEVIIQVDAMPSASIAGAPKSLCDNITTITLAANDPASGTGAWSLSKGTGSISDTKKFNATVNRLTPGENIFKWTVSNGVCQSSSSEVTISVNTPPNVTVQPPASAYYCEGTGSATLDVAGEGTGVSYLWQVSTNGGSSYNYVSGSGYSGNNTDHLVINHPSATMNGNLFRVIVNAQSGCASYVYSAPAKLIQRSVWTGVSSSDWNNASNWSDNQVPGTTCPTVTVPVVSTQLYPVLNNGPKATIINLYVQPSAAITIQNNILQVAGTITNKGVFDARNGSIELNGSVPQSISLATFKDNALNNMIISNTNSAGVTLAGDVYIYRSLTFGTTAGKLNTANFLTLKSTATETAWVGDMTGHTINGDVIVERYINSAQNGKKWLFIGSPVKGQTIKEAWMEGGAKSSTGNGVQITGPGGTAAGFDVSSPAPSMKTWNENTGAWDGVPSTGAQLYNTKGYMIFIRGDRSITDPFAKSNATTLRSKGSLITGNLTIPIQSPTDKFISISNPYAAALDMGQLARNSSMKFFTVWNPKLGGQYGYGAYETYYLTSDNTFKSIPWNKEYNVQSGQAFFVQTSSKAGAAINFSESVKAENSLSTHFRQQGRTMKTGMLQTTLSSVASNGERSLLDGTLQEFNDEFANDLDEQDGRKVMNSGENIAIKSSGKNLIVERRQLLTEKDTVQYNISGLAAKNYLLEINAESFAEGNLQPYLEDTYLSKKVSLNISGTTEVPFTVTNVAGSSSAKRFRIVFGKTMAPLPVILTSVTATASGKNIEVKWKVENQVNVQKYEVERSENGNQFTAIASVVAENGSEHSYSTSDKDLSQGSYFYRIKSVDIDGKFSFSKVVKATIGGGISAISVFPNPVTDGKLNLQLQDQIAGKYLVRLINTSGQVVLSRTIDHAGGSALQPIPVNNVPAGVYQLEVSCPDGQLKAIKVVF